jgi:hypothetical protein
MSHPIHSEKPNAATPATRPGESPPAAMKDTDPRIGNGATPVGGPAHTPKRDGDNSGGESTASERRSSDKGHQHTPRPGADEHQGGH